MSPRFVLGRENVLSVAEVVNRSLKADCTDFTIIYIRGVPKNLLESGERYTVGSPFHFVFSGCLIRRKINAARIVLFKSTIKLNNFSQDKQHNL